MKSAIESASPAEALQALAESLKAEEISQRELYDLFEDFAARYRDHDETKYDAILDTMDRIVGYCSQNKRLFETDLF